MTAMGDVSRVLGMNVSHDVDKRTVTSDQKDYTEDVIERFHMKGCKPTCTPGVEPELSLN